MKKDAKRRSIDLKSLRTLIALMRRHDLIELELAPDGHVRLRRREESSRAAGVAYLASPPGAAGAPAAPTADAGAAAAGGAPAAIGESREGTIEFKSPIVGTFYRAPSPDKEAFVDKGSRVKPESVLCIIEAMKVMNEIRAELAGEIVEVLAKNGEAVEFGQPLFLIRPEA